MKKVFFTLHFFLVFFVTNALSYDFDTNFKNHWFSKDKFSVKKTIKKETISAKNFKPTFDCYGLLDEHHCDNLWTKKQTVKKKVITLYGPLHQGKIFLCNSKGSYRYLRPKHNGKKSYVILEEKDLNDKGSHFVLFMSSPPFNIKNAINHIAAGININSAETIINALNDTFTSNTIALLILNKNDFK